MAELAGLSPAELKLLLPPLSVIQGLLATRYLTGKLLSVELSSFVGLRIHVAAGLVLVLYDHLLTLPAEIKYMWSSKRPTFDFVRIVFFFVRYSNEAGLLIVNYCKFILKVIQIIGP